MSGIIHVRTGSRLHFGMFSFGQPGERQFGGVGMMVDEPSVELTIKPARQFFVSGCLGERARRFAEQAAQKWAIDELPGCEISVQGPPSHAGLGVGTQLGLAVAAGLQRYLRFNKTDSQRGAAPLCSQDSAKLGEPPTNLLEFLDLKSVSSAGLAAATGRGVRSAVGTHGFELGGLIVDAGKLPGETLGRLERRVEVPSEWRVALFMRRCGKGLSGPSEVSAFAQLPPVPRDVSRELRTITSEQLIPAIERGDCDAFGEAVYEFGVRAGDLFAAVQGGPFANSETARLVSALREQGVRGVGQSSWGPTVFAIVGSDAVIGQLSGWLGKSEFNGEYELVISRPRNCGAEIRELS